MALTICRGTKDFEVTREFRIVQLEDAQRNKERILKDLQEENESLTKVHKD